MPPPSPPSQSAVNTISPSIPAYQGLGIHRGAIDKTTITTQAPPDAMARVRAALETMGIVVQAESEYRYRCIRPRRIVDKALIGDLSEDRENAKASARADADSHSDSNSIERKATNELATDAFKHTSVPSTTTPDSPPTTHIEPPTPPLAPAPYAQPTSSSTKSRSPSPEHHLVHLPIPPSVISATSSSSDVELISAPEELRTITYGKHAEDPGDELRFSVELTRLSGLDGTYSLDIRRLKGNLRSYKFIYDSLRRRVAAAL
ncbi:hypothetical protein D9615_007962 [Tricholomella constricta]|uniref:KA1 domain-containing protein n=1 Tax=Tricholomella constricta TaxID=117010 RepID=A0A8H5H2I6_9AGAR|nr:hypothetical protein D9615_007962 [Tricholomella constricta]